MWRRNLRSPAFPALLRNLSSSSSSRKPLPYTSSSFGSPTFQPQQVLPRLRRCNFLRNPNNTHKSDYCKSAETGEGSDRCWNCSSVNQTAPFLVCQACRSIQPVVPSVDYFQIFGLGKTYEIQEANIEGKYKDWQKKLHPDLVHSKSEKEREYAAEQSARVIDARRTLSDPLSRAIYMLKLEGIDVDEEQTISEPELLTEIMEIREAVEEAADSKALNHIRVQNIVRSFRTKTPFSQFACPTPCCKRAGTEWYTYGDIKWQMQEKLKHWYEAFAVAFQSRNYEEARSSIQRMTYYKRVNEEITKKL